MKLEGKGKQGKNHGILLGLGLDSSDGHVRVTKGDNFRLLGGSEETHDKMTETAVKFNEKISAKGKTIADLSKEEFVEIISDSIVK